MMMGGFAEEGTKAPARETWAEQMEERLTKLHALVGQSTEMVCRFADRAAGERESESDAKATVDRIGRSGAMGSIERSVDELERQVVGLQSEARRLEDIL